MLSPKLSFNQLMRKKNVSEYDILNCTRPSLKEKDHPSLSRIIEEKLEQFEPEESVYNETTSIKPKTKEAKKKTAMKM